jgi:hypothetical protein
VEAVKVANRDHASTPKSRTFVEPAQDVHGLRP